MYCGLCKHASNGTVSMDQTPVLPTAISVPQGIMTSSTGMPLTELFFSLVFGTSSSCFLRMLPMWILIISAMNLTNRWPPALPSMPVLVLLSFWREGHREHT